LKLLLKLGWRNIWRNKRRTILTVLAVVFATFLTIVMRGIGAGTWEYNVKNTVEMFSGYLQIQREGYQDTPSLTKSFAYPGKVEAILKAESVITGYAPRILADGLLSFKDNSAGTAIFGVQPEREERISRFRQRVNEGRFFEAGSEDEIVLGYKLLENLKAQIGDTLVVLAQGFDGVLGNLLFRVVGTVKLGSPEFDGMAAFIDLSAAQELLAMEGRVNVVALSVADFQRLSRAQQSLTRSLHEAELVNLVVLPWDEVMVDLKQAMEFDRITDIFFLGILIVIVTFGILNTILMSVTERFREFGVTLAIGMQPRNLVWLVFIETTFIAVIGIIIGGLIGHGLNWYFTINPIQLTGDYAALYEEYGFIPLIIATRDLDIPLTIALSMLIISFLSCIYPAYRVSRLEPLKGIRYT
jgi:putative ABC transport system permease protein